MLYGDSNMPQNYREADDILKKTVGDANFEIWGANTE
jgi:hypothetical protein